MQSDDTEFCGRRTDRKYTQYRVLDSPHYNTSACSCYS